jgi:uncharacterized protein with NRDE domain
VPTQSTWFALNKKTGDFACLTNFRTKRNRTLKKKYDSRGFLVMEYVKINDPEIPNRLSLEKFLSMMYDGSFKGFNLIFGNILDQAYSGKRQNGTLRVYQETNLPDNCKFSEQPKILIPGFAHGLSNGSIN